MYALPKGNANKLLVKTRRGKSLDLHCSWFSFIVPHTWILHHLVHSRCSPNVRLSNTKRATRQKEWAYFSWIRKVGTLCNWTVSWLPLTFWFKSTYTFDLFLMTVLPNLSSILLLVPRRMFSIHHFKQVVQPLFRHNIVSWWSTSMRRGNASRRNMSLKDQWASALHHSLLQERKGLHHLPELRDLRLKVSHVLKIVFCSTLSCNTNINIFSCLYSQQQRILNLLIWKPFGGNESMNVLQTEWTSAAIDKHDFLHSNINIKEKRNKRDDDEHTRESIDQQNTQP